MSYEVECKIVIAGRQYLVSDVSIVETWRETASTAYFTLPRVLRIQTGSGVKNKDVSDLIKEGDAISIESGYLPKTWNIFTGQIHKVYPGERMQIECLNEARCLQFFTLSYSNASLSLRTLMKVLQTRAGTKWAFKSVKIHADVNLGKVVIDRATGQRVMDSLRDDYGIDSFCRDGVLHVGLAYVSSLRTTHQIDFSRHVQSEGQLRYIANPMPTKVTAISLTKNAKGGRLKYTEGSDAGRNITIHRFNADLAGLKAAAKAELARSQTAGYEGVATLWGWPRVRHGDILNLYDPLSPTRKGGYAVAQVTTRIGTNTGIRQDCLLDGIRIITQ